MAKVVFVTPEISVARRKLAAAHELHDEMAESIGQSIELYISARPLIITTGQDIWCSSPQLVAKLGHKLVHLADDGDKVDPLQQEKPVLWEIRLPAVLS
jgi:hypothetical protein